MKGPVWYLNSFLMVFCRGTPPIMSARSSHNEPTDPFTVLELQDQEIGEIYVAQERHVTNCKAQKL